MYQKYKVNFNNYSTNQSLQIEFNSISFYNNGTTPVTINNVVIHAGDTLAISGNANEVCNQEFYISFGNPLEPLNNVLVTIKEFV